MDLVDPLAQQIHQRCQVALGAENLGLEATRAARGRSFVVRLRCLATHDVTRGRINRQSLGITGDFAAAEWKHHPAVETDP